jgi:hypothetical protein
MKKSLFILLFILVSLTFSSCSKDASINRKIDGEWNVVTIDGEPLDGLESYVFKFNKDKSLTGDGTINISWGASTLVSSFTYSVADEKIICVLDGDVEVFSILTLERKKLALLDSDNSIWVLEPK